jgi:hypothetical protein
LVFDLSAEKQLCTEDEQMHELMDLFDLVFCYGSMPQDYKERIVEVVTAETAWMKNNATWRPQMEDLRVQGALIATVLSPFAAVAQ